MTHDSFITIKKQIIKMKKLENKVAVVTGASKGIMVAGIAKSLAAEEVDAVVM